MKQHKTIGARELLFLLRLNTVPDFEIEIETVVNFETLSAKLQDNIFQGKIFTISKCAHCHSSIEKFDIIVSNLDRHHLLCFPHPFTITQFTSELGRDNDLLKSLIGLEVLPP